MLGLWFSFKAVNFNSFNVGMRLLIIRLSSTWLVFIPLPVLFSLYALVIKTLVVTCLDFSLKKMLNLCKFYKYGAPSSHKGLTVPLQSAIPVAYNHFNYYLFCSLVYFSNLNVRRNNMKTLIKYILFWKDWGRAQDSGF